MSIVGLAVQLVVAQQQHEPPAAGHFVLLAGAAVAALAIFGVRWLRGRRDATASEDEQSPPQDRAAESVQSEDE
jgi:hypothetical protein